MTSPFKTFAHLREAYENRDDPESARALASVVWRGTLVLAFVMAIAGAFEGFSGLSEALSPPVVVGEEHTSVPTSPIDRAALETILLRFEVRSARFALLTLATSSDSVDPSR